MANTRQGQSKDMGKGKGKAWKDKAEIREGYSKDTVREGKDNTRKNQGHG